MELIETYNLEVMREDIVSLNIAKTFELLFNKNNNVAYKALQDLQKESEETDCVYPYMDRLSDMLESDNSYIRTRAITLLAYNTKWDKDYKIEPIEYKFMVKNAFGMEREYTIYYAIIPPMKQLTILQKISSMIYFKCR